MKFKSLVKCFGKNEASLIKYLSNTRAFFHIPTLFCLEKLQGIFQDQQAFCCAFQDLKEKDKLVKQDSDKIGSAAAAAVTDMSAFDDFDQDEPMDVDKESVPLLKQKS